MKPLILDVETTISNKGNPFDQSNKLVCVGIKTKEVSEILYIPGSLEDYMYLQGYIDSCDILVGFNIKFDLHWLRKIGIKFDHKPIWDCQLGEFILNNQKIKMPSLDDSCERRGLGKKIDTIKLNYWDKGINTDEIPREELSEYLAQDLALTEELYKIQREIFQKDNRYRVFKLQCQDLLVLEEMEWNGLVFNTEKARARAKELQGTLDGIYKEILNTVGNIPININSNHHLSAILYGGNIVVESRIPIGVFKTGKKIGQIRNKVIKKVYELPRLVEPLKNTEAKVPEGSLPIWKTNEDILRALKANKSTRYLINLCLEFASVEKLRGTYLEGWSNLIDKMNWPHNKIHGNLNQTTAITCRLSSTKPNLQNADPITKIYCESRYE